MLFKSYRRRKAFERGVSLLTREQWEEAASAFRSAIALAPDDPWSHNNLAIALLKRGAWEEAAGAFEAAIARNPDFAESHTNLGAAYARLARWDEAARAYRRAVALDARDVAAQENLGIVLTRLGRWEEAIAAFEQAVALGPDVAERHLNLGTARLRAKRWGDSVAALRRALELDPDLDAARRNLDEARMGLVASQPPATPTAPRLEWSLDVAPVPGAAADQLEDFALSRQRLVAMNPGDPGLLVEFASALAQLERWDEAGVACHKALALAPDLARVHPHVPGIFVRAKRWSDAAMVFSRAAERAPDSADARANLAVALANLERWSDAARELRAALAADPGRSKLREALAAVLSRAGRWDDAIAAAREWVARDPASTAAAQRLAEALANRERVDQAAAAHERIVDEAPHDPAARRLVAIGLARLGCWEAAVSHLEAGGALAPEDVSFPFLLVDPLLRLGRGAEAVAAHRRAVELGGALPSLPARADETPPTRELASTWAAGDFTASVTRVERWLERLGDARAQASPAAPSQAAPPASGRAPRLLFVLDEDYGELTLLKYLALGQALVKDSTLLLPERLFANNANAFPARTRRYASLGDVLRVVDGERPDVVFLCSGYLLAIHGLFASEELDLLVSRLRDRGCRIVTSDPFLGLLSEQDPRRIVSIQIPETSSPALKHVKSVEDRRLWTHFAHAAKLFANVYHLYPACDRLPAGAANADERNLSSFNPALICPELGADAPAPARTTDAGRPHWLFILSQTDYEAQAMAESPHRFADIVACRFVEALAAGRQPILIGPKAFLDLLVPRLPTIHGLHVLAYCPFDQLLSLLLSAEHAFYWNVVSHSILIRLFNRLPVVLFDKGHLVRNVPSLYDRVIRWYYRGVEPEYFDHHEPLSLERLRAWEQAGRPDADRILAGFRAAPTPDALIADLLRRPATPGGRP